MDELFDGIAPSNEIIKVEGSNHAPTTNLTFETIGETEINVPENCVQFSYAKFEDDIVKTEDLPSSNYLPDVSIKVEDNAENSPATFIQSDINVKNIVKTEYSPENQDPYTYFNIKNVKIECSPQTQMLHCTDNNFKSEESMKADHLFCPETDLECSQTKIKVEQSVADESSLDANVKCEKTAEPDSLLSLSRLLTLGQRSSRVFAEEQSCKMSHSESTPPGGSVSDVVVNGQDTSISNDGCDVTMLKEEFDIEIDVDEGPEQCPSDEEKSTGFSMIAKELFHKITHAGEKPYDDDLTDAYSKFGKTVCSNSNRVLESHRTTYAKEKPYKCIICEKAFEHNCHLKEHTKTHTKPYECPTCRKAFSHLSQLHNHVGTHSGEKPYCCNTCGKTFRANFTLKLHIRTHTGEKPFQCNTCERMFSTSWGLKNHIRTHTGEKPYHCITCDKVFSTNIALNNHNRTHSGEKPYHCNTCGKTFAVNITLKNHIRTHTGEKPYKCNTCERAFSTKNGLSSHKKTHTGEKPYKCNRCEKAFSFQASLTYHMERHSPPILI